MKLAEYIYRIFKEDTDLDLEQKQELSKNLGMDIKQVNSWFYKRHLQIKVMVNYDNKSVKYVLSFDL